jgi:predicted DsbA family dithiol-disulfide isomerase
MHWAGLESVDGQRALKHALLGAYHTDGENPGSTDVLLRAAARAGLDVERARSVIESDAYASEVREAERHWQQLGISSVPSVIIDDRHLIQGGQPPEVFERALRQLAGLPVAVS